MATAIEFENISKLYRLGLVSTGALSDDLHRWWTVNVRHKEDPFLKIGETNDRSSKGESNYVWALKDIDFKVEQGDVVGIIGKNGAGKSTLLKILSRVTAPTTGTIRAHGRIGSLLEVGTGFHPEMTGRENIYLNGAILGMTKAEITRKLDEIIDFSGCERYIDTPVKRYSSGMMVRLGFAVAAHLDPEILVVDEVLAVGDAEFQKKAIGKMQDVSRGEGRTVLFVSHNMAAVRQLCRHGLLLENGRTVLSGNINTVVQHYLSQNGNRCNYTNPAPSLSDKLDLLWVEIGPEANGVIARNNCIHIKFAIRINQSPSNLVVGFTLYSGFGHPIARTDFNEQSGELTLAKGEYTMHFDIPANTLAEGRYWIEFDVAERAVYNYAAKAGYFYFDVTRDDSSAVFVENIATKNSIIHQNWFTKYREKA